MFQLAELSREIKCDSEKAKSDSEPLPPLPAEDTSAGTCWSCWCRTCRRRRRERRDPSDSSRPRLDISVRWGPSATEALESPCERAWASRSTRRWDSPGIDCRGWHWRCRRWWRDGTRRESRSRNIGRSGFVFPIFLLSLWPFLKFSFVPFKISCKTSWPKQGWSRSQKADFEQQGMKFVWRIKFLIKFHDYSHL